MSNSSKNNVYNQSFYAGQVQGSCTSAGRVVPLLIDRLHPMTVVDVGCGLGSWLAEFSKAGCRVRGVDGSYVDQTLLRITANDFVGADLEKSARDCIIPGLEGQRFSLCVSLEVAEHITPQLADNFIQLLTQLSDYVLFSAAIPHQGGTHHVNEQWPDYWIARFAAHDYVVQDFIRPLIWEDQAIETWYRQNLLLFVKKTSELPCREPYETNLLTRVVHPDFFLKSVEYFNSQEHLRSQPSVLLIKELMTRISQNMIFILRYPLKVLKNSWLKK